MTRLKQRRRVEFQRSQRQRRASQQGSDGTESEEEDDVDWSSSSRRRGDRMGRWNMSLIRRNFVSSSSSRTVEDETGSSDLSAHRNLEELSINYGRCLRGDKLMDRIGTFATLTSASLDMNTNPENNESQEETNQENRANEAQQIIVTALTT